MENEGPDPQVALFADLVSGNVSDAMERLGLRRTVLVGFTMLAPPGAAIVGRAFTIRQHRKHASQPREKSLVRHGEVSRQLAQPGDIVVMDTGGIVDVASWGENHSMRCMSRGVLGLVSNGATRDADLIRKLGFPVFCRGFSPVKSLWDMQTVSINEPVLLDQVEVRPRDIVFADESGIIVVPATHAVQVAEVARTIRDEETAYQASSGFTQQFGL